MSLLAETVSIALLDALPEESLPELKRVLASNEDGALEAFLRTHIPDLETALRARLARI